VLEKKHWVD